MWVLVIWSVNIWIQLLAAVIISVAVASAAVAGFMASAACNTLGMTVHLVRRIPGRPVCRWIDSVLCWSVLDRQTQAAFAQCACNLHPQYLQCMCTYVAGNQSPVGTWRKSKLLPRRWKAPPPGTAEI